MRDANFFPRRIHSDATAPVEPVGARIKSPGTPGTFVVERGDKLQQSVTGGIDMGAQLGDFGFERLGPDQGLALFGRRVDTGGGLVHDQHPCRFRFADYNRKSSIIRELYSNQRLKWSRVFHRVVATADEALLAVYN